MLATDNPPEECSTMSASVTSDEIKNELKTTLTARRGLGAEYDDHFVDAFMERLKGQLSLEMRDAVLQEVLGGAARTPARPESDALRSAQWRLKLALVSLVLCPALLGVALATTAPWNTATFIFYLVLMCLILLVNLAVNLRFKG
jgi:hypothetical protein